MARRTTIEPSGPPSPGDRRVLSTGRVVFLVIAAAAPLAAMVGNIPLALIYGNGAGLPAAFLVGMLILLCFSVGYAAMGRRVVNTGAFYTYIARSLGKPAGIGAAYVAVLAYTALTCGLVGSFGYFTRLVLLTENVDLPWYLYSAVALVLVAALGYRSADLSAKVLGTLMIGEFAVLLVFDVVAAGRHGGDAFPAASWTGGQVFSGSVGIALMFAFVSFVGFESAALYGEETRSPERSIPRATYIAVTAIGLFYILTSWIVIGAAGGSRAPDLAGKELGDLVFTLIQRDAGTSLYNIAAVLLCTSLLASLLALHNAASRYLFALGRERVLPHRLGRYHPRHLSPHIGSLTVTVVATITTVCFAVSGADAYTAFAASTIGLGTLGVIALQAGAAVAVIVFFRRRPDRDLWRGVVAPAIGFAGLATGFALAVVNYATLTGSASTVVNAVPVTLAVAAAAGVVVALRLRSSKPAVYAGIAESQLRRRDRTAASPPPTAYRRKYCLVGAGPSGLVMGRALVQEGVPFDWFEKHTEVGGIWDMDNPGSPMYRSAHFISSKYTSGFYGFPMPADYPDYPTWRQIRDYIREFAHAYDLPRHITFGVAVSSAEPLPDDRWSVTLSTGEVRVYDGLIAAPGVTWHPNEPTLPGAETFTGEIRHSVTFHDGMELRDKRVLVVGAGNSGVDIACDAARHADAAFLSVRRGYRYVPKHVYGVPTDALLAGLLEPPKGVSLPSDPTELVDTLVGDLTRLGLPAPDHDLLTSHPIMNTQVLHHLAHGDLIAKPDVRHLTATGVAFADGSSEDIDVVLLATGYEYRVPFLDEGLLRWKAGHPQLYLNVFSREHDSLYVLGFIEFADAAYKRFDEMAQLIVMDIRARETGTHKADLDRLKSDDTPDLSGGMRYLDSPRHANYVNSHAYQTYLAELRDRFDWPYVTETTYSAAPAEQKAPAAPERTTEVPA
ncbi:amino acid permease [Streptomyces sp. GESEQ-35]|uniref:amino acid permease n=1 Tax=Streptomyces sp. GESEQ-35 TaxID=2812657 RepID=UPI001B31A2DB|nr:amino acid permease [Streptomyces sp. GESEQ-35]